MFCLVKKYNILLASLAAVTLVAAAGLAEAAKNQKLRVTVGQSVTHKLPQKVKTVSIADSDVADVVVAGPREVLINGKKIGLTTLVVWDEFNVSTVFDVAVRGPFSDQQIELRVQVAEINRTKALELGFDMLYLDRTSSGRNWTGGTFGGPVATPKVPLSVFDGSPVEELSSVFRYFRGGTDFQMMIKALTEDGVLRVLAEPTVVAASGQHADFLAGGEIPVPIASSGAQGGTTITIEWREFGVKVNFIPTIVDSGVINLHVAPEVSSLDFSNGIEISGFNIPALRTRKAQTTVELKDEETLVVGGLIMEEETNVRTRIPLLGHIPLLGYLFSNTEKLRNESELMLVVSPHIVHALAPGSTVKLPGVGMEGNE